MPGLTWVRNSANWNGTGHAEEDRDWPAIGLVARKFVFTGTDDQDFPTYEIGLTPAQTADIKTGDHFYVLIDAVYGLRRTCLGTAHPRIIARRSARPTRSSEPTP